MNLSPVEIRHELNDEEINKLKSIYNHRCLTKEQLLDLHYKKDQEEKYEDTIERFEKYRLIEKEDHFTGEHYFLTTIGINVLREAFDLPTNIYDYNNKVVRRGYYRAGELKISNRFINHQHSLNEFLIGFKKQEHEIAWKYYDEKHMSAFRNIRPDGLLSVADIDFFIEIDMNTESRKQLNDKWENYRRFLCSREYAYSERKIIVLFVVENAKYPQTRIDFVKHTIESRLIDRISENFDIYIDTKENILEIVEGIVKASQGKIKSRTDEVFKAFAMHGFSVAYGDLISKYTGSVVYDIYGRKINENNEIILEDGKLQEYVIDSYVDKPFSVLKKIAYLNNTNAYFSQVFQRELTYIVVIDSEEEMFKDLRLLNLIETGAYYTTLERLEKEKDFNKAIIEFDGFGNIYTFKDKGLKYRQFEREMEDI